MYHYEYPDIVWDMETASEVSEHGQELGDLEVEVVNQELDVDVTMYTDTRNELLEDKHILEDPEVGIVNIASDMDTTVYRDTITQVSQQKCILEDDKSDYFEELLEWANKLLAESIASEEDKTEVDGDSGVDTETTSEAGDLEHNLVTSGVGHVEEPSASEKSDCKDSNSCVDIENTGVKFHLPRNLVTSQEHNF